MKIALVILRFDIQRGGAERYTCDLANALVERGLEVEVVCGQAVTASRAKVVSLGLAGVTRLAQYKRFIRVVDERVAAGGADIVHAMLPVLRCDFYHPHAGLAGARPARKHAGWMAHGSQRVAHLLNGKRAYFAKVERELLSGGRAPRVLCLSKYIRQQAVDCYSLASDSLPMLFNGVDIQRFDAGRYTDREDRRRGMGIPPAAVVALMVAQDFARKGLRQAIEALAACSAETVLVVVGKDDAGPYQALAARLKIGKRLFFLGALADVAPVYAMADYFVLPTRHDPCSLVALEALAMGLPLISTTSNGACDAITSGVEGYILEDPDDVPALTCAMQRLDDPARRLTMSAACVALRDKLSFEHHVDRLQELYERR